MHNKLVTKVNVVNSKATRTSETVSETQFDSEKQNLKKDIEDDKKIPNISALIK